MTSENLPLVVAQKESRKNVINTAVSEALNSRIPHHSQMEPGRVYVGRLPNHNGPVLVRRRRKSFTNPFGVPSVASLWAPPRAPSLDYQNTTTAIYQPQPQSQMLIAQPRIYTTPPQVVEPPAYLGLPPLQPVGTTTTTITTTEAQPTLNASSKHTCAACGKFRSARYHYRHPLAPGVTPRPTLCRKCIKQHTSSEEFDEIERARWKKKKEQEARQRRIHRSSSSEHWESSSSQEGRRRRHRYRSSNDSRRHRRFPRSSSGVSNAMYIIHRPAERRRLRSSSESIRFIRRVRSLENRPRPRPLPRPRHGYGPFDGHHSYEEYFFDEDEADHFGRRGRSRSRSVSRQSYEDSHSIDEDYVRISTSVSHRRPPSLLDRLTRSRSHSRSSSRSRWRRRRPNEYEEERVRVTIRSRDPSPGRYERHEHEYEERVGDPWRRGSESMIVHRDATTLETRGNDYFDRQRLSGRSFASSSQIQTRRTRSPSILRRRSMENGMRDGRRVRFAHSDESEEGFRSAEQLVRERGFRHIRALSPAPIHYESRRRRISHSSNHDEDDDFGYVFDRGHLSPPIESYSYARRRSHSREHSDSYYGGGSYESRRRIRVIDV